MSYLGYPPRHRRCKGKGDTTRVPVNVSLKPEAIEYKFTNTGKAYRFTKCFSCDAVFLEPDVARVEKWL